LQQDLLEWDLLIIIVLTTAILFFLFALKSVSFGLPYALLFATVGAVYPLVYAIIVNLIGIYINIQIPYFIGRKKGEAFVIYTREKFPLIEKFYAISTKSQFLFTFIIKIIGKIPHEITNLFLGALKIHYFSYITASLLALLPTMIPITLMAKNYDDPGSPIFIVSLAIFLIMPIISFIIYFTNRDSNKK
jgi:uncharacterized membrane protein YdjX (TVP38/TMEM64 family)